MKLYRKILNILALGVIAASCVEQIQPVPVQAADGDSLGYEHDGMVTFGFTPDFGYGPATKAMVEGADIKNIYVAVFDAEGFKLSEYTKATPATTGDNLDNNTDYQYTVELKVSDKPRFVHIIANAPKSLRFGSENEVIGELFTKYDSPDTQEEGFQNAYWQRLAFDKIWPKPKSDDPDSLAVYNAVKDKLNGVKLIRNYSKVSVGVHESCTNFTMTGFWFLNEPDRGSVAPYNRNTGSFVTDYINYPTVESLEGPSSTIFTFNEGEVDEYSLAGGDYQGFMLASTNFITPNPNESNKHLPVGGVCSGYVYEREKAISSPLYIIVEGYYNGSASKSYYKIAMQAGDGKFYAMLRNFNYLVEIVQVSTAGYGSAAAALAGAPSGDISVNVDYQELPNISDGDARITVSGTSVMIIGTSGSKTSAEIQYKYEPDINDHSDKGLGNEWIVGDVHDRPFVAISQDASGSTGNVIESIAVEFCYVDPADNKSYRVVVDKDGVRSKTLISSGDFDSFGHITVNTTEVGSLPKTQSITITGKRWGADNRYHTITRTVNLVLRESLELSLSASPNTDIAGNAHIEYGTGRPVVMNLAIDGGLPSSMFPLEFKIEPTVKSLTPDSAHSADQELPVRYGKDASGYPTYWFEKVINWAEYTSAAMVDGKKSFPVYFSTIIADSGTTVRVSQPSFMTAAVMVYNYTPATFSSLAFSGTSHKVGQAENFSFSMSEVPSDGKVTVAMKGLEPASLSGFTYKGRDAAGYWLYEYGVSSTSANFDVVPFAEGNVEIRLSAYLFADASASVFAVEGDLKVYANTTGGTNPGDRFASFSASKDVNSGNLIPGQKVRITVYLPQSSATTVSVGGVNLTRSTGGSGSSTITLGGIALYRYSSANDAYTVPDNGDNSSGFYDLLPVTVNGALVGSVKVPVYGIQKGPEVTTTSTGSFDEDKYYLIQNRASSRYLYNTGSNNSQNILSAAPVKASYLWQFGSTASPSTIKTASSSTQYYLNMNRSVSRPYTYTPRLSTSSSNWNINFSNNAMFFNDVSYSRYVYDNGGTIAQISSLDDNCYWHICPVTFVAP